ncbi:rhodanese-like domain-containing protein [Microbacterium laevaniformans]|uniref:rhodanese-like domain-containing protein n=1 Tax=Microbacterium laevaniformans TaxID=36807 RepID=UPI003638B80B
MPDHTSPTTSSTVPLASADEPVYDAPLISPQDAAARLAAGALVVDVRSDAGREKDGVIPGSIRGDRTRLDAQFFLDSPEKLAEVTEWDQEIVIVCGSVRGSGPVAEKLRAQGFTNVSHVDGGFPAWRDAGGPAEAPSTNA